MRAYLGRDDHGGNIGSLHTEIIEDLENPVGTLSPIVAHNCGELISERENMESGIVLDVGCHHKVQKEKCKKERKRGTETDR